MGGVLGADCLGGRSQGGREPGATLDAELVEHVGEMSLDGSTGDEQGLGDLAVGEPVGGLFGNAELVDEAERLYVSDFFPNLRPVAALKARLWIANSQLRDATAWAHQAGLSADDEPSHLGEYEYITLARLLLARAKADRTGASIRDTLVLLGCLLQDALAGARAGGAIEILALEALALYASGNTTAALVSLEHALPGAEPEGYGRLLIDEGQRCQTHPAVG